jgi:hypothetical protein
VHSSSTGKQQQQLWTAWPLLISQCWRGCPSLTLPSSSLRYVRCAVSSGNRSHVLLSLLLLFAEQHCCCCCCSEQGLLAHALTATLQSTISSTDFRTGTLNTLEHFAI